MLVLLLNNGKKNLPSLKFTHRLQGDKGKDKTVAIIFWYTVAVYTCTSTCISFNEE